MKIVANKIISALATFTLIASMSITFVVINVVPGAALDAHADGPTSEYSSYLGQTVNFCGNQWDVIGLKDGDYVAGSSSATGTNALDKSAMLLLHTGQSLATTTAFNADDNVLTDRWGTNIYDGSTLQSVMSAEADVCETSLDTTLSAAGVKDTTLTASATSTQADNVVSSTGNNITSQKFFPLSYNEAVAIPDNCQTNATQYPCDIRDFSNYWWLRSPGSSDSFASLVIDYGFVGDSGFPVDSVNSLARPALQISLDSFLAPREAVGLSDSLAAAAGTAREASKETITLANRKYDVIGANALVQPIDVAVIGDPGTLTLLYSADNVGDGVDQDAQSILLTMFNAEGDGNAYKNSLLQQKLIALYQKFGNNATDQVISRDIPTDTNYWSYPGEAYDSSGAPIEGQNLWPLSFSEAYSLTDHCGVNYGDLWDNSDDHCYLRSFSDSWWIRSPYLEIYSVCAVADDGYIFSTMHNPNDESIDWSLTMPWCSAYWDSYLARPALQISSTSGLLTSEVSGLSVSPNTPIALNSGVTAETPLTATVLGDSVIQDVTWSSKNSAIATVDSGVVTGVAEGTTEVCTETPLGEYQRCVSVSVVTPNCDDPAAISAIQAGDGSVKQCRAADAIWDILTEYSESEQAWGDTNMTIPAGNVVLLLSNYAGANMWVGGDGTDAFDTTNNDYMHSDIRTVLLTNKYNGLSPDFKSHVTPRTEFTAFCGGSNKTAFYDCESSDGGTVSLNSGDDLWLLSTAEANAMDSDNARKFDVSNSSVDWWLRSPGNGGQVASVHSIDGRFSSSGIPVNNDQNTSARPAFLLNLDSYPHDCTTRRDTCTVGSWVYLDGMRWDVVNVNDTESATTWAVTGDQPANTATVILSKQDNIDPNKYIWSGTTNGTWGFCNEACMDISVPVNNYSTSDLRTALLAKYNSWTDDDEKNLVKPRTSMDDFGGTGNTEAQSTPGAGDTLWALSVAEADALSPEELKWTGSGGWWLRSHGGDGNRAAIVDSGDGNVNPVGGPVGNAGDFSARPALFLNLKSSITPTASIADIAQGNTPAAPIVTGNEGEGAVTATYTQITSLSVECNASTNSGDFTNWSTENPAAYYCARVQISETTNYTPGTAYAKFKVTEATPTTPNIDYENETLTGLVESATYEVGGTPASSNQEGKIDIAAYNLFGKSGIIRTNPDTSLNSAEQPLEIPALTRTLSVSTPTFDAVTYGYSPQPAAQNLTITASGVWGATVSGVTITNDIGAKFEIAGSGSTVAPSGTLTSYTIQPKLGLSAGTHTVQVAVVYNDGTSATTATENVSITVNQKSVTLAKGSLAGVTRPFRTDDTTVELTGTAAITGLESADLADVEATCTGHYSDGNSAENKDITIDSCELSGDKADNYTISGSLPTGVQGTISNYQELIIGEGDVDVVVPPGSEYNPPSAAGAGDATVVLPGDAGDEFEIEVDGHDLIVPGSSVIHEDGTIIVPAGDVTVDGVTVNVPAESVVDVSTGTIIVPAGDVTIGDSTVNVPAESVVDVVAGTITLPNGEVIATHSTGDEELSFNVEFDAFNAHSSDNFTISGAGFTPGEAIRFELHSTPLLIGTAVVNASGSFSFTGTIPANAELGDHHIVALDHYTGIEHTSAAIKIVPNAVPLALADTGVNLGVNLGYLMGLLALLMSFLRKQESMKIQIFYGTI